MLFGKRAKGKLCWCSVYTMYIICVYIHKLKVLHVELLTSCPTVLRGWGWSGGFSGGVRVVHSHLVSLSLSFSLSVIAIATCNRCVPIMLWRGWFTRYGETWCVCPQCLLLPIHSLTHTLSQFSRSLYFYLSVSLSLSRPHTHTESTYILYLHVFIL